MDPILAGLDAADIEDMYDDLEWMDDADQDEYSEGEYLSERVGF